MRATFTAHGFPYCIEFALLVVKQKRPSLLVFSPVAVLLIQAMLYTILDMLGKLFNTLHIAQVSIGLSYLPVLLSLIFSNETT